MRIRKAILTTAALALAAGILSVPGGTFARGAGRVAAHGPVFGFHPRIAVHRPFRAALSHRAPARFGLHLRRDHRGGRNGDGTGAVYGGSAAPYYSGDVTGSVPEGPAVYPPPLIPSPPAEHIGCLSRGYDVLSESGGVAKVMVTRC